MSLDRIDIPHIARLLEELHGLFADLSNSERQPQPWSKSSLRLRTQCGINTYTRLSILGSSIEDLIEGRHESAHQKISLTKTARALQKQILGLASGFGTNLHPDFFLSLAINDKGSAFFDAMHVMNSEVVSSKRTIGNGVKIYHATCDVIERIFQLTGRKQDAVTSFWGIQFGKSATSFTDGGSVRASSAAEAVLLKLLSTHGPATMKVALNDPAAIMNMTKEYWVFPRSPTHAGEALESCFGITSSP